MSGWTGLSLIVVLVSAAALIVAPSVWETMTPGIVTLASATPMVNGALPLLLATMTPTPPAFWTFLALTANVAGAAVDDHDLAGVVAHRVRLAHVVRTVSATARSRRSRRSW